MNFVPRFLSIIFVSGAFTCQFVAADTAVFNPVADTALFENNPDNNLGGQTFVPLGLTSAGQRARGLFRFDVSSIPAGSTITAVSLNLTVNFSVAGTGFPSDLHRVLQSWGEGDNSGTGGGLGTLADPGEATWKHRSAPSTSWGAPGATNGTDYVTAVSATQTVPTSGSALFSSAGMVADVQQWVNGSAGNFGWLLRYQDESSPHTACRIASKEGSPKPVLTVTYTPAATNVTISNVAKVGNQMRFTFNAAAGQSYTVQSRGSLVSGNWGTFLSVPTQGVATNFLVTDTIGSTNKFYRVSRP